jgi:hypothetical protein
VLRQRQRRNTPLQSAAGKARMPPTKVSGIRINARALKLLRLADLEDLGAALGAGTLSGRAPVLHNDVLGVLDVTLRLALHAVSFFGSHALSPPHACDRHGPFWPQVTTDGPKLTEHSRSFL